MEEEKVHLVKKVSKELGMTYKELAKEIEYRNRSKLKPNFKIYYSDTMASASSM